MARNDKESGRGIYAGMFANLGKTLARIRELRGKSQTAVARLAGIGKSQLSKYESGKELPKLDSLEKVLLVLNVSHFELFRMLALLDRGEELRIPTAEEMDDLFARINRNLFTLHREVVKERYDYNRQGSTEAGRKTFE